ncbi:RagB/SusD family nutrient uptake outer membrane protein [Flavobacterium sp. TMP13]|uniref:RagB/SusD family nutrient uptake outer membrane protein n=1 Tax=Flavobacterium sp. TMP13 TaxID=3425950 RepID=UPI003D782DA7
MKIKISKNKIGMVVASLSAIFVLGCSDEFLQDEKKDGLTDKVVYSSPETIIAVVNGIYDTFQADQSEYIVKGVFYPANFLTQDYINVGADTFFETFEIPTTFGAFNKMWIQNYRGIGRANTALANIDPAIKAGNIDSELGNRLKGECYAIRGILYSLSATNFGGIPLVLEPAGGKTDAFAPRNTQDEVFAQIVLDMEEAVKVLPWEYDAANKGRVTKGTAYAYMGSAYMWLKKYDKAIEAFEAMNGHYQLEQNFLDIFAYKNKNGKESIFEIQLYDESGDLSWGRNDNVSNIQSFCMPNEINGGGYAGASKAYYDSFEGGDLRKSASVIGPGESHPDPLIKISDYPKIKSNYGGMNTVGTVAKPWVGADGLPGRQGYYNVKTWRNPNTDGWGGPNIFSGANIIILRYGEVLLGLAESYHKVGNDAKAMAIVKEIRKRAGLTAVPTGNMIDVIIAEYRHELSGEYSLWGLLRRSGEQVRYLKEEYNVSIPAGKDLMPIPQEQLDLNPNLVQNPGY